MSNAGDCRTVPATPGLLKTENFSGYKQRTTGYINQEKQDMTRLKVLKQNIIEISPQNIVAYFSGYNPKAPGYSSYVNQDMPRL